MTPSPRGGRNKQYCAQHRQHESHKQRAITHSSPEPTAASSSLAVLFSPLSLSPAAALTCRAATVRPELDSRNQTRWLSADGPRLRRASVCSPATVTIRQRASALLAKPMNGINAPQRPDCVADDAVSCELVSAPNSLANREINREFRRTRPSIAVFVSDRRADSMAYSGIPYATEQGIFKMHIRESFSRNREI